MGFAHVLFLLVAYNNIDEVREFIRQTRLTDLGGNFRYSICDNSETSTVCTGSADTLEDETYTTRADNPGYLDGAIAAYDSYMQHDSEPLSWIIISNTDLIFLSDGLLRTLNQRYDPCTAVVVAPRITETGNAEKNPHLLYPRSKLRLLTNRILTGNTLFAMAYLEMSAIRARFTRHRDKRKLHSETTIRPRSRMYSPYGAMMIFSRQFFNQVRLPSQVPLLAEEYAIAETALRAGAPIWFEPEIHILHHEHSTTGPKVTWRRAEMLRVAFRYINRSTRNR